MCGLYGFLHYGEKFDGKNALTNSLAQESAVRGTDATGISYNSNSKLNIYKKAKSAYMLHFKLPDDARCVMGHTRHTTQGNAQRLVNNHPFPGKVRNGKFAFAHNGIISNDGLLRREKKLPRTNVETDSFIGVQLMEQKNECNMASIKYMAEAVEGSFCFSIMDDRDNLYLVKGDNPLSLLHFKEFQTYVYASTEEILWKGIIDSSLFEALRHGDAEDVKLNQGDILKIRSNGTLVFDKFQFQHYSGRRWYDFNPHLRCSYSSIGTTHLEELKSIASGFGFSPDEIQMLYDEGFTPDEIEDYLYDPYSFYSQLEV